MTTEQKAGRQWPHTVYIVAGGLIVWGTTLVGMMFDQGAANIISVSF